MRLSLQNARKKKRRDLLFSYYCLLFVGACDRLLISQFRASSNTSFFVTLDKFLGWDFSHLQKLSSNVQWASNKNKIHRKIPLFVSSCPLYTSEKSRGARLRSAHWTRNARLSHLRKSGSRQIICHTKTKTFQYPQTNQFTLTFAFTFQFCEMCASCTYQITGFLKNTMAMAMAMATAAAANCPSFVNINEIVCKLV